MLSDIDKDMLPYPSMVSVTFYSLGISFDAITQRTVEIITLNPWLTGRLSKNRQGTKLSWFKVPLDPTAYITKGKLDCSVADLSAIAAPYKHFVKAVGTGSECIGKDKPLFNVTLLELNDGFALIVSLCHTIGDGYT